MAATAAAPAPAPAVAPTAAEPQAGSGQRNAVRSAQQYLEMTSFSKSGLIEQLVFEGFTHGQAQYGADAAY